MQPESVVHINNLHLGPKPCPQQVFTLGPETVPTKSLYTWIRKPCPQKAFKLEPETVPTNSICMWARNPVLDKSSQLPTATAGSTSGCKYGKLWLQADNTWATLGPQTDHN